MTPKARTQAAATGDETPVKPHWTGHRERLRQRLFTAGAEALQDYELLELMLGTALPRRDVKPLAKDLLHEFKDLWALLHAPDHRLRDMGLGESAIGLLRATGAIALRAQRGQVLERPLLSSWQKIVDYCKMALAHESKEQFRLLFIDRRNQLIHEEIVQRGTIDHTPVYPREVVQRALEFGAGALVLVHNHPTH
jgi:DNA repair protein RadC